MIKSRVWRNKNFRKELELNSSMETIYFFEQSNDHLFRENIKSAKKIDELLKEKDSLILEFEKLFQIDFEEAKNYVENSNNPNSEFNLYEYNKIIAIQDEIDGEKFQIYQRNKRIDENNKKILNINQRIDEFNSELE